jgi:hypothetical protein
MPGTSGPPGLPASTNIIVLRSKPRCTRQPFTRGEDELILQALGDNKMPNWNDVAALVPGRTARQCRERFQHYLSPGLAQSAWTPAEDELIRKLYAECGPNWARIAEHFGGTRTNNSIKNRWNTRLRQTGPFGSNEPEIGPLEPPTELPSVPDTLDIPALPLPADAQPGEGAMRFEGSGCDEASDSMIDGYGFQLFEDMERF